jgi:hypothetical protein
VQSAHLRPGSTIVVMDDRVVQDTISTQVPGRCQPVEKPFRASFKGSKTSQLQCFGLDV